MSRLMRLVGFLLLAFFFLVGYAMTYIPQEQFIEIGSIIAVSSISVPALIGLINIHGKKGLYAVIALGLFALAIETLGIYTGFPYSHFHYTAPFGYKLFGTTPWTVFIAWSPLVIGSYLLSKHLRFKYKFLCYLLIIIATDLVLDPGAVARGLWKYELAGFWYEVPLQNYLGWLISGSAAFVLLRRILPNKKPSHRWLTITSSSLLLSLALWSGVSLAYGFFIPFGIGSILLIFLSYKILKLN